MMNNFAKTITGMLLLGAILGCNKKDDYVYPTKIYTQYDDYFLTHFKDHRLFTSTGEITEPQLVRTYAERFSPFFYQPGAAFSDESFKHFSAVNEDSLLNTGISPLAELKRTSIGVYDIFSSNRLVPVNDTNSLFLHIGQYKMHHMATTPLGYRYVELQSPAYVLKKINDTLFLPMMRYIISSQRDNMFSFASEKLNNVFDVAGVSKLKPYDTLLVQSFDIGLRRIK